MYDMSFYLMRYSENKYFLKYILSYFDFFHFFIPNFYLYCVSICVTMYSSFVCLFAFYEFLKVTRLRCFSFHFMIQMK